MIPESIRTKLKKSALLLSSLEANEVLAARNAIDRLFRANGFDWHAFGALFDAPPAQQPPHQSQSASDYGDRPWQQVASACLASATRFTDRQRQFLQDMTAWRSQPSTAQLDYLAALHRRANRQSTDVS